MGHSQLIKRRIAVRLLSYALMFACGALAMFAWNRVSVRRTEEKQIVATSDEAAVPASMAELQRPTAKLDAAVEAPNDSELQLDHSTDKQPDLAEKPQAAEPQLDLKAPAELPPSEVALELDGALHVSGVTEPAPGRYAKLPLATSQAIAFVDVKPGDRVTKGVQVFSHWESPERLQAVRVELEKTKKLLEVARTRASAAQNTLERLQKAQGSVAVQELKDAETAAALRQAEMEAAELAVSQGESHLTAMEFEFNQAFVTSPIEGIVAAVDVIPGERRQLGTAFRGVTVLDPRVLNCRCMLDEEQLVGFDSDATAPSSKRVEVTIEHAGKNYDAKVASIGLIADAASGRIPVILEVQNPDETLRCGIRVEVWFRR